MYYLEQFPSAWQFNSWFKFHPWLSMSDNNPGFWVNLQTCNLCQNNSYTLDLYGLGMLLNYVFFSITNRNIEQEEFFYIFQPGGLNVVQCTSKHFVSRKLRPFLTAVNFRFKNPKWWSTEKQWDWSEVSRTSSPQCTCQCVHSLDCLHSPSAILFRPQGYWNAYVYHTHITLI